MKKVLSVISIAAIVVLASCSPESIEPLQEQVAFQSEEGVTLKTSETVQLNGKRPLILVYRGDKQVDIPLIDIPVEDIASVNVFKGSAAISVYGEKGEDGVIVIRLK